MDDSIPKQFESRHAVKFTGKLGVGRDGNVFLTDRSSAVKFFTSRETFNREYRAYRILTENAIRLISGHALPKLLKADEELLAIEMGLVKPPFFLDFASAYFLDEVPDFPDDVWEEWHQQKAEEFGEMWPRVQALMNEFERLTGLVLLDMNPGNIKFADPKP